MAAIEAIKVSHGEIHRLAKKAGYVEDVLEEDVGGNPVSMGYRDPHADGAVCGASDPWTADWWLVVGDTHYTTK